MEESNITVETIEIPEIITDTKEDSSQSSSPSSGGDLDRIEDSSVSDNISNDSQEALEETFLSENVDTSENVNTGSQNFSCTCNIDLSALEEGTKEIKTLIVKDVKLQENILASSKTANGLLFSEICLLGFLSGILFAKIVWRKI